MTLRLQQQGSRDRDRLALAARQRCDRLAHARDARGQFVEQRPGADLHRDFVEPKRAEFAAEEDIGDDVEILAKREILENGGDAELQRRARICQRDGLRRRM